MSYTFSLSVFFAMSGYVLNIVISNEEKKNNSKCLFSKKVDFFNDRFSPLMFVL